MATENNKNIKYPTRFDVRQQSKKLIDDTKKNSIISIIHNFLNAVKIKHS